MVDELPLGAAILFGNTDEDEDNLYETLFKDHREGMGVSLSPTNIIAHKIRNEEVSWSVLRFESKT